MFARLEYNIKNFSYSETLPVYFSKNLLDIYQDTSIWRQYNTLDNYLNLDRVSQISRTNIIKNQDDKYILISKQLPGGWDWGIITAPFKAIGNGLSYVAETVYNVGKKACSIAYEGAKFGFSLATYPFYWGAHKIFNFFKGDNQTIKNYLRDIENLEDEIDDLGIEDLENKIENIRLEKSKAYNDIKKQKEIIKNAKKKIKKYEKLLIKCESDLDAKKIAKDGKNIETAKYEADAKLQELQSLFDNEWKEKIKHAQKLEKECDEIIKQKNKSNHNKYVNILGCNFVPEKPDYSFEFRYNYYTKKEKIPPFINKLKKLVKTNFQQKFKDSDDKMMGLGDQHSILDLVYKIKIEQAKIKNAKNKIRDMEDKIDSSKENIKKSKKQVKKKIKKRDKIIDEINKIYKKIEQEREAQNKVLSFNEYYNGVSKTIDELPKVIYNGLCELGNGFLWTVNKLYNGLQKGFLWTVDKLYNGLCELQKGFL